MDRICHICKQQFTATRKDAKTCSSKCRQKSYRIKKTGGEIVQCDRYITIESLPELWFEYPALLSGMVELWAWNLAEIVGHDATLGTELEDFACGIELDKHGVIALKALCDYLLTSFEWETTS
jgi:hypothetical protein